MENRAASRLTIQPSTTETASGQSASFSVGEFSEMILTLNCTAASGTSPTCIVTMQTSDDGGTTWYDLPSGAFTELTSIDAQIMQLSAPFGDTIRASWVVAGTSPSFTFAVKAVAKG